jgi:hypothetical protein
MVVNALSEEWTGSGVVAAVAWYKKRFPETWAASSVLDDFVQVFMAYGGPPPMMLIEDPHGPLESTLWVWLPEADLLDAFPGFAAADAGGLPKAAILLAGNRARFERDFEIALRPKR